MAKQKNKNIVPLKNIAELAQECDYADFEYKEHFSLICRLLPNADKERLEIEILDEARCKEKGFVYVFVIEGKIFKIGQSISNIKERVQSYNCGKTEYRINGTNSTTNYFVLQSLLRIGKAVEVYAFSRKSHATKFSGKFLPTAIRRAKRLKISSSQTLSKITAKSPSAARRLDLAR